MPHGMCRSATNLFASCGTLFGRATTIPKARQKQVDPPTQPSNCLKEWEEGISPLPQRYVPSFGVKDSHPLWVLFLLAKLCREVCLFAPKG